MFFFEFVQFCDVVLFYAAGTLYYYKKLKTIYKNVQIKGFWLQLIMLLCKTDKHSICLTCSLIGHKDHDNEICNLDVANQWINQEAKEVKPDIFRGKQDFDQTIENLET